MKGIACFSPNVETHRAFWDALCLAEEAGVKIIALDCEVTERAIKASGFVKIDLKLVKLEPQP